MAATATTDHLEVHFHRAVRAVSAAIRVVAEVDIRVVVEEDIPAVVEEDTAVEEAVVLTFQCHRDLRLMKDSTSTRNYWNKLDKSSYEKKQIRRPHPLAAIPARLTVHRHLVTEFLPLHTAFLHSVVEVATHREWSVSIWKALNQPFKWLNTSSQRPAEDTHQAAVFLPVMAHRLDHLRLTARLIKF